MNISFTGTHTIQTSNIQEANRLRLALKKTVKKEFNFPKGNLNDIKVCLNEEKPGQVTLKTPYTELGDLLILERAIKLIKEDTQNTNLINHVESFFQKLQKKLDLDYRTEEILTMLQTKFDKR